jgi:hypothetical protein
MSRNRLKLPLLIVLLLLPAVGGIAGYYTIYPPAKGQEIGRFVRAHRFSLIGWSMEAWVEKGGMALLTAPTWLDDNSRYAIVKEYTETTATAQQLARQLDRALAESADTDTTVLENELATTRARLARLQPLAESVLEYQIGQVLRDKGFAPLGAPFPPAQMQISPLPTMLIISPRERIEQQIAFPLQPGLTAAERNAIEAAVEAEFGVSALIVNIGGLALWPAMVLESPWLPWLTDTMAHEWAHHWLVFRPLGYRYFGAPETRIINEMAASLFGIETGLAVLERYYPELVPAPAEETTEDAATPLPPRPDAFDFRREMRETRMEADRLLALGEVDSAESWMEQRRQLFVANGYLLRRLNQAYFAFHGAYADASGAGGASGGDPIGPAVMALREQSADLRSFMQTISRATTLADLEQAVR